MPNQQHSTWKRKGLSLPPRLAAELTALGHSVSSKSDHWKPRNLSKASSAKPTHKQSSSKNPSSSGDRRAQHSSSENLNASKRKSLPNKLNSEPKSNKKRKIDDAAPEVQKPSSSKLKPATALEKLLKKQHRPQLAKKSQNQKLKPRTKEEQFEDQQIAWLEAQLGIKAGQDSKAKLRQEFQEDGLEDLFDGLDELDQLVENLDTSQDPDAGTHLDVNLDEDDIQDDETSSESGHSLDSDSTWLGCDDNVDGTESLDNPDSHPISKSITNHKPDDSGQSETAEKRDQPEAVPAPSNNPARYIPPHLRSKQEEPPQGPEKLDKPPLDLRLKRQMMGILNRVSPTSVPVCLESLRDLYVSHPRAVITHGLGDLILGLISSKDSLSPALLVTYAALVSAITRGGVQVSGVEIGWAATFIAELVTKICAIYETPNSIDTTAEEFGKGGINLLGFLSHLYFFQVVSCTLVYDIVRLLIESGLSELSVEGLIVLLKASGFRLRHDDPSALKDIIILVQGSRKNLENASPRTMFMLDTLTDLKNNKVRKDPQSISGTTEELQENLKKYLGGLSKKTGSDPEPIQFKLKDLQEAHKKGKWWLVGAGWNGNPLADEKIQLQGRSQDVSTQDSTDKVMMDLARRQGMNTDVRRSIFNAIMTGEDYVDACEKINQLGLNSVQQREIIRVLLHCLGKEKNYNPYYTMIGQKLASESRSIQITMQFLLWDFFRELGEKEVGGQEMLKNLNLEQDSIQDDYHGRGGNLVDLKKLHHLAWAYGWWIAKGSLSITVLKPLPFGCLKQKTQEFLAILISLIFLSINSTSPTLIPSSSATSTVALTSSTKSIKIDSSSLETIFKKLLTNSTLSRSFLGFLVEESHQTGYDFYLNKFIKQPLSSSSSNVTSNHLDFFGLMIPQNRLVYFLNLITLSKSFVVDFLSDQI
ncbi:suppressor of glycerol defect [Puccinia graminis f. sp. tritici]|uniref:Suppressor of glycerol defect n=1 Tax=Puccinia graminis f. sp. tritici TaxID=56615 RepID=A0A5B0QPE2_PUCGR|nr:suppressor of glycerol defect [Puccinia graminis f. sp. tritici]